MKRRSALTLLAGLAWAPAALAQSAGETRRTNAKLMALPGGRWVKVHEQKEGDAVTFAFQGHGGSAFDSRRGRLVLFGSDTHGLDWTNSPLFFELESLAWHRLYANDPSESYRVEGGLPVAGARGDHPWAMHTFGAVDIDPEADRLIVASYPEHMEPGRFSDALAHVWHKVRRHPTWMLDLETGTWRALPAEAVAFFPYCTLFDSDRGVLIGYRHDGVYELRGSPLRWRRVLRESLMRYHNNGVYDPRHRKAVLFGMAGDSNDVVIYDPAVPITYRMATPGTRPPKDQHVPLAYHAGRGETVALVDRFTPGFKRQERSRHRTETWSYDLGRDAWTHHEGAGLPFGLGMNYNLAYDPLHDLLLLVTGGPDQPTAVWALRL